MSFWSDFVRGLAGPGYRGGKTSTIDPADALDTLRNLRDADFWFDDDYEPVISQLDQFYRKGYITIPPDLLRNGADIGHGVLLTNKGREVLEKLSDSPEPQTQ